MRLIIRLFANGLKISEEHMELDDAELTRLAQKHYLELQNGTFDMVEVEFLDEPLESRFLRLGTNPRGMVMPIEFDLTKSNRVM